MTLFAVRFRTAYRAEAAVRPGRSHMPVDPCVHIRKAEQHIWLRLEQLPSDAPLHAGPAPTPAGNDAPGRRGSWTVQTIRDSRVSAFVKAIHNDSCQVCGVRLETPSGAYSEGAHIRPLGRPHHGPDQPDSVLCLCPNHRVLFDAEAFAIKPDTLELVGIVGTLRTHPRHPVGREPLEYRMDLCGRLEVRRSNAST